MEKEATKKELAEIVGYTVQNLHQISSALPEDKKFFVKTAGGKKYSVAVFLQRWIAYRTEAAGKEEKPFDITVGMSKKDLSALAGMTYRRLHEIDTALPIEKKLFVPLDNDKYDAVLFVERWVNYNVTKDNDVDMSLEDAKAKHEQVKIAKTELEVARMRGELIEVSAARRMWKNMITTAVQNFLNLPFLIAQQIFMIDNMDVVTGIIDREIRNVLTNIANTPVAESDGWEGDGEEETEEDEEA